MCFDLFSFLDLDGVWGALSIFFSLILCCGAGISSFRVGGSMGGGGGAFLVVSLLSVWGLIFFSKTLALAPFSFVVSAHLFVGMGLGMSLWASFVLGAVMGDFRGFCAHLSPVGAPLWLGPLLSVIEGVSELIRPVALSLRLCANMTAGHILCVLCSSVWPSLFILVPFELGVAFIQASVFVGLLSIFADRSGSSVYV